MDSIIQGNGSVSAKSGDRDQGSANQLISQKVEKLKSQEVVSSLLRFGEAKAPNL